MNAPVVRPPTVPDSQRPVWTPAAQAAAALVLMICLAALGWRAYQQRQAHMDGAPGNDYVIDLNHADHAELLQLPGVGENLAGRIEAYREKHGPFHTVEELRSVHGIGPVTLRRLSPYVGASKSTGMAPSGRRASNGEGVEDQEQGRKP